MAKKNNQKSKKPRRPRYEISEKQLQKIKQQVSKEAVEKTCLLSIAVMADELNLSEDEICKIAKSISLWAQFLDDHVLKIEEVADIIEKKSGIKFARF